jgi:hypothetical protein
MYILLWIWVFKSGVLKKIFILSKYGTKANIRSTMMANNRHAYNRDVLQSYWTSDGLSLYCSQPTGEKTHTNQQWSNQTLQCPVVTIRCYPWSAGSWQVFHIVGLCVFSHQSVDYSIVIAHLTSNSFEGHPCWLKQHWLPNRRLSTRIHWSDESRFLLHVTDGRMRVWKHKNTASTPRSLLYACRLFAIFVLLIFAFVPCLLRMNKLFKTPDLNTQIRSVNILNLNNAWEAWFKCMSEYQKHKDDI